MPDLKALIGEIHAEFGKLESDVATRLHGLLDQLLHHTPALEAETKADAEQVAGEGAADVATAAEVKP